LNGGFSSGRRNIAIKSYVVKEGIGALWKNITIYEQKCINSLKGAMRNWKRVNLKFLVG
jgi:hypothetical protein